jgi:hypothetical protein
MREEEKYNNYDEYHNDSGMHGDYDHGDYATNADVEG